MARSVHTELMNITGGNLLSILLRCGTRPYERGTQWDEYNIKNILNPNNTSYRILLLAQTRVSTWIRVHTKNDINNKKSKKLQL